MPNAIIMYDGNLYHCEVPEYVRSGSVLLAGAVLDGSPVNARRARLTRNQRILSSRRAEESSCHARFVTDRFTSPLFVIG